MKDTKELTADRAPAARPPEEAAQQIYRALYGPEERSDREIMAIFVGHLRAAEQRGIKRAADLLDAEAATQTGYGDLGDYAEDLAHQVRAFMSGTALPTEAPSEIENRSQVTSAEVAPSSPSDLSARETEDQQELTKAAAPRSPEEALSLLVRDCWLDKPGHSDCYGSDHIAIAFGGLRADVDALNGACVEGQARETELLKENARLTALLAQRDSLNESAWGLLDGCERWFAEEAESGQGDAWVQRDKIKALFAEALVSHLNTVPNPCCGIAGPCRMNAELGPVCHCGKPSAYESGLCGDCHAALTSGASAAEPPKEAVKSGLTE